MKNLIQLILVGFFFLSLFSQEQLILPDTPESVFFAGATGRYQLVENVDELTDSKINGVVITFSNKVVDGLFDKSVHIEIVGLLETDGRLAFSVIRSAEEPLANPFIPSYELLYRPKGKDLVRLAPESEDVEMEKLGLYEEKVYFEITPEEAVEILTSPLIRLTGNQGDKKEYRLTDTDKGAFLWFLENKIQGGKEAVRRVRERIEKLED